MRSPRQSRSPKRAGVSQGSLYKHFPNKSLLVVSATHFLFLRLVMDYEEAFAQLGDDAQNASLQERVDTALDLLWNVFNDDPLQAAFELYVASRTDPELAMALQPVMDVHRKNLRTLAAALFPEIKRRRDFDSIVAGTMATMQGAALAVHLSNGRGDELAFLRRAVKRAVIEEVAK